MADAGHWGKMVKSPYAEVAHFLVVRHMLKRYRRVFFYTDASYDLTGSVMIAMHDWVRSGRAHMAVLQHEKLGMRERKPDYQPPRPREEALPRAIKEMEARFAHLVDEELAKTGDLLGDEESRVRRARAAVWQAAPQGAASVDGKFAWPDFPGDTKAYRNCRTLWLSRGPNDAPEDGHELLIGTTLQSVDSACRALRKRVNTFKRPGKSAKGTSYVESAYRAEQAIGELQTYLLMRNYARRAGKRRWSKAIIPAAVLGLSDGEEVDMAALLWSFRLGNTHAREVSEWLSQ